MPTYSYAKSTLNVDGHDHAAASVLQDGIEHFRMARFEGPPRDRNSSVYGQECQDLTALAAKTIRTVRTVLEAGPTNNRMMPGKYIFGRQEEMANTLNVAIEGCWQLLKDARPPTAKYRPLWEAATYAASAELFMGGVCAAISWVTLGVITRLASNTLACVYYNAGADHSYVLIRKRETPWFVVDPWVREPRVCPWRYNYFGASGGNTHYFDITHPVEVTLGQPITSELLEASKKKAGSVSAQTPHKRKVWEHQTNAREGFLSQYPPVCGPDEWGPGVAAHFRVEQLWA